MESRENVKARERWLAKHNLGDVGSAEFCLNARTRRIRSDRTYPKESADAMVATQCPLVVLHAIPDAPGDPLFSTAEDAIWQWLNDGKARRYNPDLTAPFLRREARGMYRGAIIEDRSGNNVGNNVAGYVALEQSGILEMALRERVAITHDGRMYYHSAAIAGFVWQFLGFACDFYREFGRARHFVLLVNIRGTEGTFLAGFGEGWREPTDRLTSPEPCVEPGLQIERDRLDPQMTGESVAQIIKELGTELGNAWGYREAPCYAHPQIDAQRPFALGAFQQMAYRSI